MIVLPGIAIAGVLCLLLLMTGYALAGFLAAETRLTRLAVASLTGLAWVIFGASVLGAIAPVRGAALGLIWLPALLVWLLPATRRQLLGDARATLADRNFPTAFGGLLLLLACLLLPYFVYPDLVFYDGRPNHDSFFWCVGAEYLQYHDYLSGSATPAPDLDHPLFNTVYAFLSWKPAWGRMGTEGFLAVVAGTFRLSPLKIYNFAVCSLAPVWVCIVLATARRLGLPDLKRWLLGFICFCQPLFVFFFANGNMPNLLGALLAGGLWLLALLLAEAPARSVWPLLAAGILAVHGLLCCYPELFPFALLPVGLLALWHGARGGYARVRLFGVLSAMVAGGIGLNPPTAARAWNGFWNSVNLVQQDSFWANLFGKLGFAEYAPSVITLATPNMHSLGPVGGSFATLAILVSLVVLLRGKKPTPIVLLSLSGFFLLAGYTLLKSFDYGWQKSVQVAAIPLATLFPALLAGAVQEAWAGPAARRWRQAALLGTMAVMVYAMVGHTLGIVKSAADKGLTEPLAGLRDRLAREMPGQTITVDGGSFRAAFFHSMWSARLFARNPIVFLPRDQPGGYLREFVKVVPPVPPPPGVLYYVAADWVRAFDYQAESLAADRVGALVREHNMVTEQTGFYRATGVPDKTEANFSFTIHPVADGWLEFTLTPNGTPVARCELDGQVVTARGTVTCHASLDANAQLVVRFPLQGGISNQVSAHVKGGPPVDPADDQTRFPFLVLKVQSGRTPPR